MSEWTRTRFSRVDLYRHLAEGLLRRASALERYAAHRERESRVQES